MLSSLGLKYKIWNVNGMNQELKCNLSAIFKISISGKKKCWLKLQLFPPFIPQISLTYIQEIILLTIINIFPID